MLLLLHIHAILFIFLVHSETTNAFNATDLSRLITLHDEYCLQRAPPGFPGGDENTGPMPPPPVADCCGECFRNTSTCHQYGACCPDVLERVPTIEDTTAALRYTCEHTQIRPHAGADYPNGGMLWMRNRCADDYSTRDESWAKCEFANELFDLDTKIPMTDTSTYIVYRNKYCALCNGVLESQMRLWNSYILCKKNADNFYPDSMETIVRDIYNTEKCNIVFKIPRDLVGKPLPICGVGEVAVSQCNVTGQWSVYDPFIEAACYAYRSVYSSLKAYRNVFCYVCNNGHPPFSGCMDYPSPNMFISFSALLKAPETSKENANIADTVCSDVQIYDPYKKICRNLTCTPPKVMINRKCENIVDDILGVWYRIFLKLAPTTTVPYDDELASKVNALELNTLGLVTGLTSVTRLFQVYYSLTHIEEADTHNGTKIILVEYFVAFVEIFFRMKSGGINSVDLVQDVISLDGKVTPVTSNVSMKEINYTMTLEYMESIGNDVFNLSLKSIDDGRILTYAPMCMHSISTPGWSEQQEEKHVITRLLICPLVELDSSEYNISIDTGKAYLKELNVTFKRNQFMERVIEDRNEKSALVCMEPYLAAITRAGISIVNINQQAPSIVDIVSVICTCLSLCCLVMSLVTYILFKELRTQPGINNMILICNLFSAQSLFQFGIGQALNIPKWACTVVGILIHFLWMLVLMAMNVCSLHMFRVFNSIRKAGSASFSLKLTVVYVLYCIGVSFLIVAVHIIVSLSSSSWSNLGYGGDLCYISDNRLLGYFFVCPIVVLVFVNISLFLAVVIKVSRMPTVESNVRNTRNNFKIYAKLSSVTGITWVFGFLYYFTQMAVLEYAFILFNACQGIFIFVSFVCNRRVLNFYKAQFCHKNQASKYVEPKSDNKTISTAYTTSIRHVEVR